MSAIEFDQLARLPAAGDNVAIATKIIAETNLGH